MKTLNYIATFSIGLLAVAVAIGISFVVFNLASPDPEITINVHNQSSRDIAEIYVTNDFGVVTKPGVKQGQSTELHIPQPGDGGYSIKFYMADGALCSSNHGDIMPGSISTELLTDNGVMNTFGDINGQCVETRWNLFMSAGKKLLNETR